VWRLMGSNHRRLSRQIYSLLPLATRANRHDTARAVAEARIADSRSGRESDPAARDYSQRHLPSLVFLQVSVLLWAVVPF
jgi:hypothetical protein